MSKRERLIQQLDEARDEMRAILADTDPEMRLSPTWTVKEVVAHITGWDVATIEMLRAHAVGEALDATEWVSIDHYNARTVETRRGLSYEQVVSEWEGTRDRLASILDEMQEEKYAEPLVYLWGQTGTVAQLVAIMVHHEAEHAEKIRKQKAVPPEVH